MHDHTYAMRQRQRVIHARILRLLSLDPCPERVAVRVGCELATVQRVAEARREAKVLLAQGCDPETIYANFCDLLTRKACGADHARKTG